MKKALAILLTAVMLLGVLTACGSKKDDAADDTQNTEEADKAAADKAAPMSPRSLTRSTFRSAPMRPTRSARPPRLPGTR